MGRAVDRSLPERVPAAGSGMTGRRGTAGLLAWPAAWRGLGASAGACLAAGTLSAKAMPVLSTTSRRAGKLRLLTGN